ncbi:helix-turn-helix domain-containing protein [Enterococcus lactis]|uniref:helix-turn-helix domain-containing protein n=1 Tax=Enterococcus lactis TaxID=357441 RepID=UPI003D99A2F0
MKSFFISTKNKRKLNIVKYILFSDNSYIYFNELMEKFFLNKSTLQRYLHEITEDLSIFEEKVIFSKTKKGQISMIYDLNLSIKYIIAKLESIYIQQSPITNTLNAIATKNYSSVTALSNDLHLTENAIYKHLEKIHLLTSKYNIAINFSTELNFTGKEYNIRYFLFKLHWTIYSTIEPSPLLEQIDQNIIKINYLKKYFNINKELTKTQEVQLQIITAVTLQRAIASKKIFFNIGFIKDTEPLRRVLLQTKYIKPQIDTSILSFETPYLLYFIRIVIPDIDNYSIKKEIVNYYQTSHLPLFKDVDNYCKLVEKHLSINFSDKDYTEIIYLLILITISLEHLNLLPWVFDNLPIIYEDLFSSQNMFKDKLNILIDRFPLARKLNIKEKKLIKTILYSVYKKKKRSNLINIYIAQNLNPLVNQAIKHTLSKVFTENLLSFCNSPLSADIVISNGFEQVTNSTTSFYFDEPNKEQVWKDLINFVSLQISKRIFYYLN